MGSGGILSQDIAIESIALERMTWTTTVVLGEHFAIAPKAEVLDWMTNHACLSIRQDVLGQVIDRQDFEYPADWWQAFKERWFPAWLLKRFPVVRVGYIVEVKALYPKIALPDSEHFLHVTRMTK
jgi:hypothetical protein